VTAGAWIPVRERMPLPAQDAADLVYCRVIYERGLPPARQVGYFDGGEWKCADGIKFASHGATVTHWFSAPELPA
jgi:hypothetical protein